MRFPRFPQIELLETRIAPATLMWSGAAGDGNWFNPQNWDQNVVPSASDAAILAINSTINLARDATVGAFHQSDGVFTSASDVTLTMLQSFDWTGGRQTGGGTTLLAPGSMSTFAGTADKILDGRTLDNFGTLAWTDAGAVNMPGSVIRNEAGALFDVQTDAGILIAQGAGLPSGVFNNAGVFRKSGGNGVTEVPPQASVPVAFHNTCIVDVQSGIIRFNDPSLTNSGTFNAAAGATIEVKSYFAVSDGSQFTGAGSTRLLSGTTTIIGSINSGSLILDGASLTGTHTLVGGLSWISGTLINGATTFPVGATLRIGAPANLILANHTLINSGTVTWSNVSYNGTVAAGQSTLDPAMTAVVLERVRNGPLAATSRVDAASDLELDRLVSGTEQVAIREALRRTNGNKSQAARLLGLSRNGLAIKMERYGIKT
jgi:hypothetical protein